MPKRKFAALHSAPKQLIVEPNQAPNSRAASDVEDTESQDRYSSNVKITRKPVPQLAADGNPEHRRDAGRLSHRTLKGERAANTFTLDRVHGLEAQYKTLLVRYLKAARGVERQKLGRRLKQASTSTNLRLDGKIKVEEQENAQTDNVTRGEGADIEAVNGAEKNNEKRVRLQKEIQALREMKLEEIAELHLLKSLLKGAGRLLHSTNTAVALRQDLEARVQALTKPNWSQEHANVLGRLFRVNNVIEGVGAFIDKVKAVLETEEAKAVPVAEEEDVLKEEDSDFEGFEEDDEEAIDLNVNDGTMDVDQESSGDEDGEALLDRYASRLASSEPSSSDEDSLHSDFESESSSSRTKLSPPDKHKHHTLTHTNRPTPPRPSKPTSTKANTTFLPSLSLAAGGYISGSGSDSGADSASDIQDDRRRQTSAKNRKNRMGQQARRALAEKKYGSGANHLKTSSTAGVRGGRDGAVGRRGARMEFGGAAGRLRRGENGQGTGNVRGSRGGGGGGGSGSGANTTALGPRAGRHTGARGRSGGATTTTTTGTAAMHPSWEAARRAKEARTGAEFKGKKVVF